MQYGVDVAFCRKYLYSITIRYAMSNCQSDVVRVLADHYSNAHTALQNYQQLDRDKVNGAVDVLNPAEERVVVSKYFGHKELDVLRRDAQVS